MIFVLKIVSMIIVNFDIPWKLFKIETLFKCIMYHLKGTKKFELFLCSISVILVLIIQSAQAVDLYADLEITVDNAGFVSISGNTNYNDLLVENAGEYTSKTNNLWTLNITKNIIFSDFVFSIILPEHAMILSVVSNGTTLISEESGNLVIKGYGINQSLSIVIEYQTNKILETVGTVELDFFSMMIIACIIVLVICFLLVLLIVDKRKKPIISLKQDDVSPTDFKGLNERQKKILILLQKSNVGLTQTDIQRELNIPKAAVSRNIRRLELKGLIEKEQIGMSNIIRLKKP